MLKTVEIPDSFDQINCRSFVSRSSAIKNQLYPEFSELAPGRDVNHGGVPNRPARIALPTILRPSHRRILVVPVAHQCRGSRALPASQCSIGRGRFVCSKSRIYMTIGVTTYELCWEQYKVQTVAICHAKRVTHQVQCSMT